MTIIPPARDCEWEDNPDVENGASDEIMSIAETGLSVESESVDTRLSLETRASSESSVIPINEDTITKTPLNILNVLNIIGFLLNIFFTLGVGQSILFRYPSNEYLSYKYQTLITPQSTAFIIWPAIFSLQGGFTLFQLSPKFRGTPIVQKGVRYWYFIACLLQVGWTFAFAVENIPLSILSIMLLWVSLMMIVNGQYHIELDDKGFERFIEIFLLRLPFEMYGGWITLVAVLNVNIYAVEQKEPISSQFSVAIISLSLLLVLGMMCMVGLNKPNYTIPLVLSWAYFWIHEELRDPLRIIKVTFDLDIVTGLRNTALTMSIITITLLICSVTINISCKRHVSTQRN